MYVLLFLKIMLKYHFHYDCFIEDKTHFLTILYEKIMHDFFLNLAITRKVVQINQKFIANMKKKIKLWILPI